MNKLILIFSLIFLNFSSFAQAIDIAIKQGISFSAPDLRHELLHTDFDTDSKKNRYIIDIEYFMNVNKNISLSKKVTLNLGLGYSLLTSKANLPVNNGYFDVGAKIFITARSYYNHNLQVPIGLDYGIINRKNLKIGIATNIQGNIAMLKQINTALNSTSITDNLNKWEFKLYSIESFNGIFVETQRLRFSLDCRFFNGKFKDDAITNNGLAFDKYNPFKLRFSVGYLF